MRKATLKDIAKAAEVSVATVSYVLNNAPNQTIPDDTRCRVLDAAKQLNYVPNLAARSLVKQKSGLIGILINRAENEGFWRQFRNAHFIERLERLLTERGYHVVLTSLDAANPKLDIISERKLDGVFVIDVKKETFHLISSHFSVGVPLIVVDSHIDDSLFYKLNYNYADAFEKANTISSLQQSYLIIDSYNNMELVDTIRISSGVPDELIHVLEDEEQLRRFLAGIKGMHGIVLNEFAATIVAKHADPTKLTVICSAGCPGIAPPGAARIEYGDRKPAEAFQLMMQLIDNQCQQVKQWTTKI
ncbi:LacI family transcriptional regulator [Paenibacillus alkaliterrae]|uniref:LacI family DNA-binding transcriptional regulator n=1 Tax=Paenibacillus alkaliterrae TaxID=320909 RepID=UPI001F195361|nr:LacI family DNA-binding transcriptional regulator [Paenibacillus alkaliterrae]MCF2941131.1 LacI family transcriptional regulator [Paenibacillus alkaliterrae]